MNSLINSTISKIRAQLIFWFANMYGQYFSQYWYCFTYFLICTNIKLFFKTGKTVGLMISTDVDT